MAADDYLALSYILVLGLLSLAHSSSSAISEKVSRLSCLGRRPTCPIFLGSSQTAGPRRKILFPQTRRGARMDTPCSPSLARERREDDSRRRHDRGSTG